MCLLAAAALHAQGLTPSVSQVTASSFTLTWTTSQPLNTQVLYAPVGQPLQRQANWLLVTSHAATVTGLQPATTYTVEAESSYYSNPDLLSPALTVTTAAASGGSGSSAGAGGTAPAGMSTPSISGVTAGGFTVSWSTTQALNTQLHYGVGSPSGAQDNWILTTSHSATVTGLTPGTTYAVQAESSYYSNPDLLGPVQTVTTLASAGSGSGSGTGSGTGTGTGAGTGSGISTSGTRLFPASGADWLYSAPTGTGLNISGTTGGMTFQVNTHTQGFDYPVAYTDGSHGCTTFTDTLVYNLGNRICVPNPASGYYPSVGGWGADDGHLVVVDTATGMYYDFWKLYANGGTPTSTNVGGIFEGSLSGNGTPGTTAADITGLAGDILPGELDCATCLNHALSVIVPGSMNSNQVGHQAPAQKTDGAVGGAVFREGAKIRFDPSINVSTLNVSTAVKAIMRALQLYGGVITDQTGGSQISFYSALPSAPDLTGLNQIGQHLFIYY